MRRDHHYQTLPFKTRDGRNDRACLHESAEKYPQYQDFVHLCISINGNTKLRHQVTRASPPRRGFFMLLVPELYYSKSAFAGS